MHYVGTLEKYDKNGMRSVAYLYMETRDIIKMSAILQRTFETRENLKYIPFHIRTEPNMVETRASAKCAVSEDAPPVDLRQVLIDEERQIAQLERQLSAFERMQYIVLSRMKKELCHDFLSAFPEAAAESILGLSRLTMQITEMCEKKGETLQLCADFYKRSAHENARMNTRLSQML